MRLVTGGVLMIVVAASAFLVVRQADAVVICQKGRKIRLRTACGGKEMEVTLNPDSVLKALKQVDGTGSGLDADLWRGKDPERVFAAVNARLASLDRQVAALQAPSTLPLCGDSSFQCNGRCPAGQVCSNVDSLSCVCLPGTVGCNVDLFPMSNGLMAADACSDGTCPTPKSCKVQAGFCYCG